MQRPTPKQISTSLTLAVAAALMIGASVYRAYERAAHPVPLEVRFER